MKIPFRTLSRMAIATAMLLIGGGAQAADHPQADPLQGDHPPAEALAAAPPARGSLALIPALFYSPETRLGAGAFAIRTSRPAGAGSEARPSSVSIGVIGTVESQATLFLSADLYRRNEALRWLGFASWSYFPAKFHGIGAQTPETNEEDYTPRTLTLQGQVLLRLRPALRAGLGVEYQKLKLAAFEADGLLAAGGVPGAAGGDAAGAGLVLQYDSRDNVFFPTRGRMHEMSVTAFGGDHAWTRWRLDLRRYLPLGPRQTVALQVLLVANGGEPPFTQLALLGGQNVLRGYYEGRDRDRHLAAIQAEYRRPLGGRFGAAVFAAAGTVARDATMLALDRARAAGGIGLRYQLSVSEGINFRLDFGVGNDSSGMYFTATEAF